jgi:hypothetical protein
MLSITATNFDAIWCDSVNGEVYRVWPAGHVHGGFQPAWHGLLQVHPQGETTYVVSVTGPGGSAEAEIQLNGATVQ